MELEAGQLDLHRFEALAEEGRRVLEQGEAERAAPLLRQALALWRGPALAEFAYEPFAQAEIARLEELRLVVLHRRIEADLALGRHAEVVGELDGLVRGHPLREQLRAAQMLALYRSGRQAEALAAYQDARQALVEQLGIDPSPALQQLERAILNQDPSLGRPAAAAPAGRPGPAAPQLPAPERAVLVVPRDSAALPGLLALAEPLARRPPRELILARLVGSTGALAEATRLMHEQRDALLRQGLVARAAAFTTDDPAADVVMLASEQPTDLVLLDALPAMLSDGAIDPETAAVLAGSPCDVGLLVARDQLLLGAGKPVMVPFGGAEHDWSAVEIAAWISSALGGSLRLLGTAGEPAAGRRDASRLLAKASLLVQQFVGVSTEPLLVPAGEQGVIDAAAEAGLLVLGLSERWRQEGLGPARLAVAAGAASPTLLVRRGVRPGGLAPKRSMTRFRWSLGAHATE